MNLLKKTILVVFSAALSLSVLAAPALAKGYNNISTTYVRDHYQLLSSSELQSYESTARSLSSQYDCNVYLTIVNNLGNRDARSYAENYWNTNSLGRGADKNGIMFLIAVDSRDYVTITHGQGSNGGITMFTDYRISQIESDIVAKLKNNQWSAGCQTYLNDVRDTMSYYKDNGKPIDGYGEDFLFELAIVIIVPIVIAGIICGIWVAQMRTARMRTEANDFLKPGSLRLTHSNDRFLHTSRSVIKIESDKKGGGGGGSSVSLSGFGGSSGGKF